MRAIRRATAVHGEIVRHWHSVFSSGPGYEPTPPSPFASGVEVRGYFIDFRAKTTAASAAAPRSLPLPATLAQLALGWWERSLANEAGAQERFEDAAAALQERAVHADGALLWPYFGTDRKYPLTPPWHSALAQGQAASVFVRAYLRSGRAKDREAALGAIAPLLGRSPAGLVVSTESGPVLEECPSDPPSMILNGWIYALWGLWDVARGLGDDAAGRAFADGALALSRRLRRYDVGWWTRYSLYPHLLPDLAKPFYHRLHVDQMEIMHRLTGDPEFAQASRRWRSYDRPSRRICAIGQKALFVATGYR